jgi:UDP-GlcNAc3NAcA epimerase
MKIVTVVGARPQFIKAATVSHAIYSYNLIHKQLVEEVVLHTGQHFDSNMSKIFFDELDIPYPAINLGVQSKKHGEMTGRILEGVENFLLSSAPDWVLVYGDTNSTLAGSLSAAKLGIKVAHVEAGLRSKNKSMPEEINRILVDHLATKLFCPTIRSVSNLANEGLNQSVYFVGDVMLDAVKYYSKTAQAKVNINKWGLTHKDYVLCTIHRAENTDNLSNLTNIFNALLVIAEKIPVFLPLHPRTLDRLSNSSIKTEHPNLRIVTPLSYLEMLRATMSAKVILTDSGGLQKEAYFLSVPCITMRNETEWTELLDANASKLTGANTEKIISAYNDSSNMKMIRSLDSFGDGFAAEKILNHLLNF